MEQHNKSGLNTYHYLIADFVYDCVMTHLACTRPSMDTSVGVMGVMKWNA